MSLDAHRLDREKSSRKIMENFRFSTSFATADGPWCGNDDEEQKATTERVQKRLLFLKLCEKKGKVF